MLDVELCRKFKINDLEKFLVDYIDDLDDILAVEVDEDQRKELLKEKEVVNMLRNIYYMIKK